MAVHAREMNYNVNGFRNRCSDASERQTDIRSEHAVCEPRERLLCGVCMDCAQAAEMTCVEGLQEVKRFRASDLADQDSIGPMTKGCTHQIRDRDGRQRLLLSKRYLPSACFEPKQIRFLEVNLGRLLNHDYSVAIGNQRSQRVQECRLARPGPSGDQDVALGLDSAHQRRGAGGTECMHLNEIREAVAARELPDRQCRASDGTWRKHGCDPRSVLQ